MSALFNLKGKCALVTGATSGLGLGMAQALHSAGATVVFAGRRLHKLEETVNELNSDRAIAVALDVTNEESIARAVNRIESEFHPIDILVNNAGIALSGDMLNSTRDIWVRQLDTNLIGLSLVSREVVSRMIESGRAGSIINIASILGIRSNIGSAAYSATKSAVIGLTRSMALELAKKQIRVNALLPGVFKTELADWMESESALNNVRSRVPTGRIGTVDDLTGPLLLLASDAGRHMTGAMIPVDGGHHISSL